MLRTIHVKNIALIDDVEIELNNGMHVLSGETGAGKSIIIDAVNFALGKRMPKDVVREDTEYALCELIFSVDNDEQRQLLKALDLPEEDDSIILQRKIVNGRGVCKVNGESVSASTLKELSSVLIDIHGQHEHQSLLYKKKHLEILDKYCGSECNGMLCKLNETYKEYKSILSELEEAKSLNSNRDKELALASFEAEEIENARLVIGEDDDLEAEYKRMVNSKRITEGINNTHYSTGYDTEGCAGAAIGRAISELKSISEYDEEAEELLNQLMDIDSLLNDFNRAIADYEKGLSFEEEEFVETEERLNLINRLKSKYGRTIEDVLKYLDDLNEKIEKLNDYETYLSDLENKAVVAKKKCLELCKLISDMRIKNASLLEEKIIEGLKDLNFLDAKFEIAIESDEEKMSSTGYDDVEFMISLNPGEKIKPLVNVASGGELSRIMLALKAVLADKDNVVTLIFDEIDTGISGRTAQKVSEKLSEIARLHQVICVTHLPQIASMADVHYEISKSVVGDRTKTMVRELKGEEIEQELARMLSGSSVTEAVLQNARDMLAGAKNFKASRH